MLKYYCFNNYLMYIYTTSKNVPCVLIRKLTSLPNEKTSYINLHRYPTKLRLFKLFDSYYSELIHIILKRPKFSFEFNLCMLSFITMKISEP